MAVITNTQALFIKPIVKGSYYTLGSLLLQRIDEYKENSVKLF